MPNGQLDIKIPERFLTLTPEEQERVMQAVQAGQAPTPTALQRPLVQPGMEAYLQFLRQQRDIVEPIADTAALVGTGLSFIPTAPTQAIGRGLMLGGGAVGAMTHGSRAAEALYAGQFGEATLQGASAFMLRGAKNLAKGIKVAKDVEIGVAATGKPIVKATGLEKVAQQTAVKKGTAAAPVIKRAPKFEVTEAEKAATRGGRQKLTAQIEKKGGKASRVEKGLLAEQDRLGVEYRRTVSALEGVHKQLSTASPEVAEQLATQLQQLKQARSFIGKELQKGEAKAVEQSLREIGMASNTMLQMLGGGTAGAAAGLGTTSDKDPIEVRVGRAVLGAGVGAFGAKKLVGGVTSGNLTQKALDYQYFSMLASPGPIGRAFLGGAGGWTRAIIDRTLEGRFKDAAKIAGDLPKVPVRIVQALKDPDITAKIAETGSVPVHKGLLGAPGRAINASDYGWAGAITRGGYTLDEARNFTLSGKPLTKIGEGAMHLASGAGSGPGMELVARTAVPFARPSIIAAEQAFKPILPKAALAEGRTITGLERLSSAAGNVATGAAGYAVEPYLPAGTESTAAAATGPGSIPFIAGAVARQAVDEGDPFLKALLRGAGTGVGESITAVSGQGGRFGESLTGERTVSTLGNLAAQRLIPAGLRDIAQGMDPARGRETGFQRLTEEHGVAPLEAMAAPALARLPGAREVLPELRPELDVRGSPRIPIDRSVGPIPDSAMRGIFPVSRTGTTIGGLSQLDPKARADDPIVQTFERYGVSLEPPTPITAKESGVTFRPSVPDELELQKTERTLALDFIGDLLNDGLLDDFPEEQRTQVLETLKNTVFQEIGTAYKGPEYVASLKGGPKR